MAPSLVSDLATRRSRHRELPPLQMPSSPMLDEKQLPCIMITPSSPCHEYDYQVHYFEPEKLQPRFFSSVHRALCGGVALPDSPLPYSYGSQRDVGRWSTAKRFRVVLMMAAFLFFALHLLAIPKMESHNLFGVFAGANGQGPSVSAWDGWSPVAPATEATGSPYHSLDDIATSTLL